MMAWTPPPPGDPLPHCPLCQSRMDVWTEQWTRELEGKLFCWFIPNYKCACGFFQRIGTQKLFNLRIAKSILQRYASLELCQFAVDTVLDGTGHTYKQTLDILGLSDGLIRKWIYGRFVKYHVYRIVLLFVADDLISGSTRLL